MDQMQLYYLVMYLAGRVAGKQPPTANWSLVKSKGITPLDSKWRYQH
jgi:hypothetical protein